MVGVGARWPALGWVVSGVLGSGEGLGVWRGAVQRSATVAAAAYRRHT